jgi:hypothetical protein
MQDLYLRFSDEPTANELLATSVPTEFDAEGNAINWDEKPNFLNIDVLGTLYNDDAVLDFVGNVVTPPTQMEGWHVNVRVMPGEDASALEPYAVIPSQPRRVWA